MKKLCMFLLSIIFILSLQTMILGRQLITVEQRTMNHFKPNKALSDYLDAQGFKVGISRSEAISYYKLDNKTGLRGSAAYWRSDMVDTRGNPIKVGFYEGNFYNDQDQLTNSLYGIRKCIAIEKERISERTIAEAFGRKYAINYQSELCLYHHGRYIVFNLMIIELEKSQMGTEFAGSAVVISLQDYTEKLLSKAKNEKVIDDATEQIKKQMEVIPEPPDRRPVIYWRD